MPEEQVDPFTPPAESKPRRKRAKKEPKARRMVYKLTAETAEIIRRTAQLTRQPKSWVFAIVAAQLAEIEKAATVDLVNRACEQLRLEALQSELARELAPTKKQEKEPTA